MNDDALYEAFNAVYVAVDQAFLDRLDAWRAKERDLPNRSEAIRRIVMRATEPKPKKPRR